MNYRKLGRHEAAFLVLVFAGVVNLGLMGYCLFLLSSCAVAVILPLGVILSMGFLAKFLQWGDLRQHAEAGGPIAPTRTAAFIGLLTALFVAGGVAFTVQHLLVKDPREVEYCSRIVRELNGLLVLAPLDNSYRWATHAEVNKADFLRIKNGMTQAEVERIIGKPGSHVRFSRITSDLMLRPSGATCQSWYGDSGGIRVGFAADGKVCSKLYWSHTGGYLLE